MTIRPVTKRLVLLFVSSALAITGLVTGAVGANAAASPSVLTMANFCDSWTQTGTQAVTVTGVVGDTFSVVKNNNFGCFVNSATISGASGIVTPATGTLAQNTTTIFTIVGSGTFSLSPLLGGPALTITLVATAPSGGGGAVVQSPPPDIFQSVAMTGSGTCGSLNRTDLDWAAAETGNWTQSWEQWANGGSGGPVCRRVLWFDSNNNWWRSAGR